MQCILTRVEFDFCSTRSQGVHPLAFSYDLADTKKILRGLLKTEQVCEEDMFFLRVATLRFITEVTGLPYGTVCYRQDDIDDQFSPNELIGDIKLALYLFSTEIPTLKKLKLKDIPCKRTVEFLQGVFQTYQTGKNYTPFKQYLQTTMLSDLAIEAIVEYDMHPCQANLDMLQMAIVGQESLLLASGNEVDYYNDKKVMKIKDKINEFPIFPSQGMLHVPKKDTTEPPTERLSCPILKVKIY